MFYSVMELYKSSNRFEIIKMLAQANNISVRKMDRAYKEIVWAISDINKRSL